MANAAEKAALNMEIQALDFESNSQWWPLNKNSDSGKTRQKLVSTSHSNIKKSHPRVWPQTTFPTLTLRYFLHMQIFGKYQLNFILVKE